MERSPALSSLITYLGSYMRYVPPHPMTPIQAYVPICKFVHAIPPTPVFHRTKFSVELGRVVSEMPLTQFTNGSTQYATPGTSFALSVLPHGPQQRHIRGD